MNKPDSQTTKCPDCPPDATLAQALECIDRRHKPQTTKKRRANLWDYLFWFWLATFRPKAFLFMYGEKHPNEK